MNFDYERVLKAKTWQILIGFAILHSINAIAGSVVAVMIGTNWHDLSATEKGIRCFIVMQSWSSAMLALITMVIKRAEDNKFPIPVGSDATTQTTMVSQTKIETHEQTKT